MDVKVQIPQDKMQEIIDTHIRAAIVGALGKDPEACARAIVDEALRRRSDKSFSGRSVLSDAVTDLVQTAAKEAIKEWIEENKQLVKAAVTRRMREGDFAEKIAAQVTDGLASNFHVSASLRIEE